VRSRAVAETSFWVVAAAPVVAVLLLPELVLQDGGLHLSSATTLGQVFTGEYGGIIEWRPGVPPNLTVELVLLGLLHVLDAGLALKVLVCALLIGFAMAARSLVVAAGAPAPWAVLLLPFAWHRPLAMGFLDFCAAVVLMMATVACVLRWSQRPHRLPVWKLGALLLLTWATHLVPWLVALGVCVAVVLARALSRRASGERPMLGSDLIRVTVAAAPSALLTAIFVIANPPDGLSSETAGPLERLRDVVTMTGAYVSTTHAEFDIYRVVALVLYVCAAVAVLARIRARSRESDRIGVEVTDGVLLAALLGVLAAVVSPGGVAGAGGFLAMRVSLLLPLLLVPWLAAQLARATINPRLRIPVLAMAMAMGMVSLVLVVLRFPAQQETGRLAAEIREVGGCLPRNSTILQLGLDDGSSSSVVLQPMVEQVGFVAADRDALDMGNESGWVPYYLWRYRPDQRPDQVLRAGRFGLYTVPPHIDLARGLADGLQLDAVLVYGRVNASPDALADDTARAFLVEVGHAYTRVAVSHGGAAELWLRNGAVPAC